MTDQTTEKYQSGFFNFLQRNRWAARLFLLSLPLLFFLILEGGLRLFNYGFSHDPFVDYPGIEDYLAINQEIGRRFFPTVGVAPASSRTDAILKEKPKDSYRVFALGGSTTAGYPYLFNASFPSILRGILQEAAPSKTIEIANLGMSAVPSYAVRDIVMDLEPYEPDMLVIYTGHNEFYGALGIASAESIGRNRSVVLTYLTLYRLKTVQLISNLIRSARQSIRDAITPDSVSGTLMERMAGNRYIAHNNDLYNQAAENFRANIEDVVNWAAEHNVKVVLGTLVSNLKDQKPFVDVFADELSRADWQQNYNTALGYFSQSRWQECLQAIDNCIAVDSMPASQYFLQAQVYEHLSDSSAAGKSYLKAKEYDGLRFRASEHLNEILHDFSELPHVSLADVKSAFEEASPGSVTGENLMLEHLHPNVDGYNIMARSFAETIFEEKLIRSSAQTDSLFAQLPVTEVDREAGRIRIDYLMKGWPFQEQSAPPVSEYSIPNATPIQQLAMRYWREEITWEELHVQAAELHLKNRRSDLAVAEYSALQHALPMNTTIYPLLARQYVKLQRFDDAISALKTQLTYETSAEACSQIGGILLNQGKPAEALIYLEKSAKLKKPDVNLRFLLAKAYAANGNLRNARIYASQLGWTKKDINKLLQSVVKDTTASVPEQDAS